jgi:membrane protein YqaA with SNARE-associated domain
MDTPFTSWRDRTWKWFIVHAQSRYALLWLAAVSFADAIFFPVAPEVFLVALMLAHPPRWREYLVTALPASTLGACVAYFIAHVLFQQFGAPIIAFYGAQHTFVMVQHFIRGHVFATMAVGNFLPIPDKVFIYAAGFLKAPFLPFISGYFLGRGIRMSVAVYLAGRYGAEALVIIRRYLVLFTVLLVVLAIIYGMVHLHLFGL